MTFHVGQKVMCVDASLYGAIRWEDGAAPVEGQTYTVRRSFILEESNILWLDEIARGVEARQCYGDDVGYGIERFRPVKTTDISIFKSMLTDLNLRVRA